MWDRGANSKGGEGDGMHIIKTPACHTPQVIKNRKVIDCLIGKGLLALILVKTEFAIIDINIYRHHICNHRHHRLLEQHEHNLHQL